jgi:hypothetical protein
MKRTLITAMVAALFIPVGFAAPAQAWSLYDLDLAASANNITGTYPLSVYAKATCLDDDGNVRGTTVFGSPDTPIVLPAGVVRGMVPKCDVNNADTATYEFTASANGISVNCHGTMSWSGAESRQTADGDPPCKWFSDGQMDANFVKFDPTAFSSGYAHTFNITIIPRYFHADGSGPYNLGTEPLTDVTNATNVNTADARSKITNYVTLHPNRVTAMAKRFVAEPGSPINIHGYGPDKGVALARAEHVRDHLISEITRLGGDPANYPTFVVYAGNPDHKKNIHVTIHQHAVRGIGTSGW